MRDLPLSKVYQLLEPGPVVLLTTSHKGRPNVMTMSWHMMVEFEPPLVACIVSGNDHSFAALRATKQCVIAIPAAKLGPTVVRIGNCSGRDVDKFKTLRLKTRAGAKGRGASAACLLRQPGMQSDRYPFRQQVQPLHSGGAEGLDRSETKVAPGHSIIADTEDLPSTEGSSSWHRRCANAGACISTLLLPISTQK